jgi:hypothetical protein
MAVELSWHVRNHLIFVRLSGHITFHDLEELYRTTVRSMQASDAPMVHVLMDDGDITDFPKSIPELRNMMRWQEHHKLGWVVAYPNNNPLLNFIATVLSQTFGSRYRRVESLEDALTYLRDADLALANLDIPDTPEP